MITSSGQTALRRYFAGYSNVIADTLVLGLGDASNQSLMQCEWLRLPTEMIGTNQDNSQIIFKGEANTTIAGKVYEVGILQGANGVSSDSVLSNFNIAENWSTGSFNATNSRLEQALALSAGVESKLSVNAIDVSQFGANDKIVLAGFAGAAGNVDVTLTFNNNSTAKFTVPVTNGYAIASVTKAAATLNGAVDWRAVVGLTIKPTVAFSFDLLKFVYDSPINEILVARTVLSTPITVSTALPIEVEYPLGVTV